MSTDTRRRLVAGNWKMHLVRDEAIALAAAVAEATTGRPEGVDVMIVPPTCFLADVVAAVGGSHVIVGAQNLHPGDFGAKTGEVSGPMLTSLGVRAVLCGHSERRHQFGESEAFVGEKVTAAHAYGLTPVLCVGETLEDREAGRTEAVVASQLRAGLAGLSAAQVAATVIAYEPVWAIGTGKTATPEQAQAVHAFIRRTLADQADAETAASVTIQYGGSVKPANAPELLSRDDIDGALVGGASLTADSFAAIVGA